MHTQFILVIKKVNILSVGQLNVNRRRKWETSRKRGKKKWARGLWKETGRCDVLKIKRKKMVMKGVVHCVKCCRELVLIELPFIMGANPGWSRLKSGEELQSMRKTGHWELCCKEGRDVMVCSRKWQQMGCKALAMQHPCTCGPAPVIAGNGRESGVWGDAKVKLRECAVRATASQWSNGLSAAMISGKEGVESLKRKRMLSIL